MVQRKAVGDIPPATLIRVYRRPQSWTCSGSSRLLIRLGLTGGSQPRLVTTFVSDQPLGFDSDMVGFCAQGDSPRR